MPENYITVPSERGGIHISEDVIAEIVRSAVSETEGVAGFAGGGADLGGRLGFRSSPRGVSVRTEEGRLSTDVSIYARFGEPVAAVGERVQKAAAGAVESMTGLETAVNVHVAGISFDK